MDLNSKGLFLFLNIILSISTAFACAPHSPKDVFIARVQSIHKQSSDTQNQFEFQPARFVFQHFLTKLFTPKPTQWHSDFPAKTIKTNDLVIGLAYPADSATPSNYQISTMALLACEKNIISIDHPIAPFTAWDRQVKSCSKAPSSIKLLDGFLEYDQNYYLAKLHQKYPSCEALFSAFPKS
ncbi:hypothetical protein BJD20_04525 [Acinetobacter proteolyticus]|uniref:hypothetical protein n=1 Tax=Acinetobacter proteolyticus TaxID=1776741 RepID=UPI0008633BC8|nr:hypothetical protein [Acinetobacter proteolyticus]OEY93435.1 hypothetical protein BJD20_04525 [Acinetobacter proteolyticus]